jgi:cyclophilin family peptidyl-prolyl cis-trans isomerase
VIERWTGKPAKAAPRPLPAADRPTAADLETLASARVAITIRDVGRFDIKLLPQEAPLNAWRFWTMARQRDFNGLAVHRVVPNLLLQAGSPGANEYAGHGRHSRDEVGLQSNLRGTVGVSTRGRDTGDGQFYVNLVDTPRFDFTYTVFGQVERGVEVLDAILEGDVIERVEAGTER